MNGAFGPIVQAFGRRDARARHLDVASTLPSSVTVEDDRATARPEPADGELYGPVEVGAFLGVKPQVVVNWIRDDRVKPSATDDLGRNRFTAADVRAIRESLGHHRPGEAPVQGAR